jgi:hypothetical protein
MKKIIAAIALAAVASSASAFSVVEMTTSLVTELVLLTVLSTERDVELVRALLMQKVTSA